MHRPQDTLALPEPTTASLIFAGTSIATELLLLLALTLRMVAHVELHPWSVLLAFVAGVAAADFASGLVHWAADTWGRADLPVIGPRVLWPFRVHHTNPDDFLRRRFLDTNGDVAALVTVVLGGILLMPLDRPWQQWLGVAGLGLCAFGGWTNQSHQWAHMPSPPRVVRVGQAAGVLLRPADHAAHHGAPYHGHYCITTGWCNRPLEAARFFRRLEKAVTFVTGAVPREDERRLHA
jgi:plasmanylethanolamine desaturase